MRSTGTGPAGTREEADRQPASPPRQAGRGRSGTGRTGRPFLIIRNEFAPGIVKLLPCLGSRRTLWSSPPSDILSLKGSQFKAQPIEEPHDAAILNCRVRSSPGRAAVVGDAADLGGRSVALEPERGRSPALGSRRQADRYGQRPGQPGGAWSGDAARDLQFLAGHPDLVSMDPARQRPVLEQFRKLYPQITYAHTIGPNGIDVARTDGKQSIDYYDRAYFQRVIAGAPFAWENPGAVAQHGPSRAQPGGAHCRSRRQSRGGRGAGHGSGVAGPDGRGGEGRADGLFVRCR